MNIGKFVIEVWSLYNQRLVPMMAAGIAFYFLLGLIPFLFITTALSGFIFRRRPEALSNLSTSLEGLLPPGIGNRILEQIHSAVDNWQTFGILGLIALFFVAMGLFESLDWGINGAMGTRKKVGFLTGRLISLAYVTGAMVFFSLAAVTDYAIQLMLAAPALTDFMSSIHIPRRTFSMATIFVFLIVLYTFIPVRTPKFRRAAIIALLVAAVWAVMQKAGATVTVYISRRHAVYGALAGGALFLTWMYLLSMLILLGATLLEIWGRVPPDSYEHVASEPTE